MQGWVCPDCGKTDQKRQSCQACRSEYARRHYEANKERYNAYREANKERRNAASKAWREANKERYNAIHKAHYEANKERIKAVEKAYREANKERRNAAKKAWREANKECLKVRRQTPECKARKSQFVKDWRAKRKRQNLEVALAKLALEMQNNA
jgi:rubredoxin